MGPRGHDQGTWQDDEVWELLAHNRLVFYRQGCCCRWLCAKCQVRHIEDQGGGVPDAPTSPAGLTLWNDDAAQEKQEQAALGMIRTPPAKRDLPPGLCRARPVTATNLPG